MLQTVNLIFIAVFIFGFTGCAKPNYETRSQDYNSRDLTPVPTTCMIRFSYSKNCLVWYWESRPLGDKPASLIFKVFRPNSFDDTPVSVELLASPQVTMEMPSMRYCSSPLIAEKLDTGTYRVQNLIFATPGMWQLRISNMGMTTIQDEVKIFWDAN